MLDVEAIIIGGGLGLRLGEPYVERIREAMMPHLFSDDRPPAVELAALGDLGGAIGASLLVTHAPRRREPALSRRGDRPVRPRAAGRRRGGAARPRAPMLTAVVAGTLIDVDHVVAARSARPSAMLTLRTRPRSHALLATLAAGALGTAAGGPVHGWAAFAGLTSHLLRDASDDAAPTPLLWPLQAAAPDRPRAAAAGVAALALGSWALSARAAGGAGLLLTPLMAAAQQLPREQREADRHHQLDRAAAAERRLAVLALAHVHRHLEQPQLGVGDPHQRLDLGRLAHVRVAEQAERALVDGVHAARAVGDRLPEPQPHQQPQQRGAEHPLGRRLVALAVLPESGRKREPTATSHSSPRTSSSMRLSSAGGCWPSASSRPQNA